MPSVPTPSGVAILFRHPSRGPFRALLRRPLRAFFKSAADRLLPGRPVTCLITDDSELQALNLTFRRKDSPTDVLSFRLSDGTSAESAGGELAISLDRAAAQAAAFGHSVDAELRILILHGLLHLAGMDHETDHGEMARAEALWRKRFKLPAGLVERSEPATAGGIKRVPA